MTAAPYSGSVTLVFRKTGPGDGKAYLARIVGLDPKFGFKRDFLVSGLVTDPGIYEAVSYHYGKREGGFHVVLPVEGKLQVVKAREQTVVELLQAGRPVTDLRTITDEKGRLTFRKDGELMWGELSPVRALLDKAAAAAGQALRDADADVRVIPGPRALRQLVRDIIADCHDDSEGNWVLQRSHIERLTRAAGLGSIEDVERNLTTDREDEP